MLEYDKIDISEGIDVNKINASRKCLFFPIVFFNIGHILYEPYLWNSWGNLM